MTDFIGRPLQIGDFVFGASGPQIWEIVSEETEDRFMDSNSCRAKELGKNTEIRLLLSKCLKISKDEVTHYLLQKGIRR